MNYEVKAVLSATDENGKALKKTEQYLVINATSCASAEYAVMSEKSKLKGFEIAIKSSKESNLETNCNSHLALDEKYYKIVFEEVVSEQGSEKLKFKKSYRLVQAIDIHEAIVNSKEFGLETVSIARSRIVEIIEANE